MMFLIAVSAYHNLVYYNIIIPDPGYQMILKDTRGPVNVRGKLDRGGSLIIIRNLNSLVNSSLQWRDLSMGGKN